MVIEIKKGATKEEVEQLLKQLKKTEKPTEKRKLSDFFGTMKGIFGDGLAYQKKVRSEWD